MTRILRPYQAEGVRRLQKTEYAMLGDEPGLGKTSQLLHAASGPTLIICPAMLIDVWHEEIAAWGLDPEQFVVTSYSMLNRRGDRNTVVAAPRPEFKRPWGTIIWDECHYLKGRKTTWSLASKTLTADRRLMATGTPIPNWAYELWMPAKILQPHRADYFSSYWRWVDVWFTVQDVIKKRGGKPVKDISNELRRGLDWHAFAADLGVGGGHWLRRERDTVLTDLPPLTQQTIYVGMTTRQAKVYRDLKKDFYAQAEDGQEIILWSSGGLHAKLMKVASGLEVELTDVHDSGKLDMLEELMLDRTHPTLICTAYRQSAEEVAKRMRAMGKQTVVVSGSYSTQQNRAAIQHFREGRANILSATIAKISEGLTLTEADTVILFERDPRPSKNEQAIRRIHRIGQTRPCHAIDLVTKGTVDAKLLPLLKAKSDHQMEVMSAMDFANLL